MENVLKSLLKKKLFVIGFILLFVGLLLLVKPSYAVTYTRNEIQNMVAATAVSYLYNNESSDYNSKSAHASFSYRTMKVSPESVSRSNLFHIDCSSFVTSVYRYSLNYDFAENYKLLDNFGTNYIYDYGNSKYFHFYDSVSAFRKAYLINNRNLPAGYFSEIARQKKNSSGEPYIAKDDSSQVVFYYDNEKVGDGSLKASLDKRNVDIYKYLQPGDIIAWDGHVVLYVGNYIDKDNVGVIHSNGYDDYFRKTDVFDNVEDVIGVGNFDNSIRYNSKAYIDDKLANNEKPLSHIAILRPINHLCSGNSCNSSIKSGDLSLIVNEKSIARDYFNKLDIEQYYTKEYVDFSENTEKNNKDLTDKNVVDVSNEVTYKLILNNKSNYSYCSRSDGVNYLTASKCNSKGYTWNTINRTEKDYTNLVITAKVPDKTVYVENSCGTNCDYNEDSKTITWSNINVLVDKKVELSYKVKVDSEGMIVNEGMNITDEDENNSNKQYAIQLDKFNFNANSSFENNINNNAFVAAVNRFKERVDAGSITYTSSSNENYKKDIFDSTNIALGSLSFPKMIYYNAFGIDLGDFNPTDVRSALFDKVEALSDGYVYLFKENASGTIRNMLVDGMYGGKLVYSADPNVGIKESNGLYNLSNSSNYRVQYADVDDLEIGDIIIVYDNSNTTYMYCGKESNSGRHFLMNWNSKKLSIYTGEGDNKKVYTAKRMYKRLFGHNLFVVLRPSQVYGTTVKLNYNGGTGNDSKFTAYNTYKNLNDIGASKSSYNVHYEFNKTISGVSKDVVVKNELAGWYSDKSLTNKVSKTSKLISNSIHTLYAGWKNSDITLPNTKVTGYKLEGWYSDKSLSNKVGNPGDNYNVSSNVTLYAKWIADSYQVQYDANGGIGTMSNSEFSYGKNETLKTNSYTRDGYIFEGWSTTKDGNIVYLDGASVKNLGDNNSTIVLYAVWKENVDTDVSVTLNVINGSVSPVKKIVKKGESVSFTPTSNIGYSNSSAVTCTNGQSGVFNGPHLWVNNVTDNTVCTFSYSVNKYNVKYDANGGTGTINDVNVSYGEEFTLSKNSFVNLGYKFIGWSLEKNGYVEYLDEEKVVNLTFGVNDVVLYAIWEPIEYEIEINYNDETRKNLIKKYNILDENIVIDEVVRPGYKFIGWTGSNGETPQKEIVIEKGSYGNKEYKANWEVEKYQIKYLSDNNGEITGITEESVSYQNNPKGTTLKIKEGYNHLKWAANKNVYLNDGTRVLAGDVLTMDDIKEVVVESNVVFTAYQYIVKYSIKYDGGNNGSISGIKSEEVSENSTLLGTGTKANDGYVFSHWLANKDVTLKDGTIIKQGNNISMEQLTDVVVTGDLVLTAMYKKELFIINYVSDGNGIITGIMKEEKMIDEKLSGSVSKANDNYKFLNWIADKDLKLSNGKIIAKGTAISNEQLLDVVINDDITFTAVHVKEELVLVYKGEDGIIVPDNNKEIVKYGYSPLGIDIKSDGSSTRKLVYVINRDVVLKDGTVIVSGKELSFEQLQKVIVTDDLVITAKYQKEEIINNIPDTFKMNSVIGLVSGLIFVIFGISVFYTTIYKKKLN